MIRKVLISLVAFGFVLTACAKSTSSGSSTPTTSGSAASCATGSLNLVTPGTLTVATDNPVFSPWFEGTGSYPPWTAVPNKGTGNPASGVGYESATAYAIADQLGFSKDQVKWIPVGFNESYKPGPKEYDFYIGQVSYSPERAQAVEFSDGYYNVQQALVVNKGTPIANLKTFADLKNYQLGVQVGTTSYNYIVANIQPTKQPRVYDQAPDVYQALNNKQIDGYVVDAPDAYVNVLIGEAKNGVVVGQFPTIGQQEHFGVIFQKGNPLVGCVNDAVTTLNSDGTLAGYNHKWLKGISYPTIKQ